MSVRAFVAAASLALLPGAAGAQLPYAESFDGADGSAWPTPWTTQAFYITVHDIQGNRGRLSGQEALGSGAYVARMLLPGFTETDIEAEMTLEFENAAGQGIGFYARQNGGTLREYLPHGQGYALFLKGGWGWPEDLGIWREIDGQETQFATGYNPVPGGLQDGVRYRVRYRVTQHAPDSTLIQAKVWPEASVEPGPWTVEVFDSQPELQNTPGSFALDVYNFSGTAHVFVDDLVITNYPNTVSAPPLPARPEVALSEPWPHPATGSTRILCSLPDSRRVTVQVFDTAGRPVRRVFEGRLGPGDVTLTWNGRDDDGLELPPGAYFLRLTGGDAEAVRKIILAR